METIATIFEAIGSPRALTVCSTRARLLALRGESPCRHGAYKPHFRCRIPMSLIFADTTACKTRKGSGCAVFRAGRASLEFCVNEPSLCDQSVVCSGGPQDLLGIMSNRVGECCIPISAAIYPKRYCEKRLSSFLQLDDERYAIIAVLSVNCPVHPGQVHPGCVKPQTKLSAPVRVADAQLENTFTVFQ